MITYDPLWEKMRQIGATTYTLQVKGGISSSTIRRLRENDSVSTNTIDALCALLHCTPSEIIHYIPENNEH